MDRRKKSSFSTWATVVVAFCITHNTRKFQGTYLDGNGNLEESWGDDLCKERAIEVLGNIYDIS